MGAGEVIQQSGATIGTGPEVNFIASDVASNTQRYLNNALDALYVHELGNALGAQIYGIGVYESYGTRNAALGISDPDIGAAFESCVYGGIVGLRSGRVGRSRELD